MAVLLDVLAAGVVDASGDPLSSGVVYVYQVGTTTKSTIYSDKGEATATSNPLTLSAAGIAEVYVTEEVRLVIEDSTGTQLYDIESAGTSISTTTTTTTTTTSDLSRNQRYASSRKPSFYNHTVTGTSVTVPASSTSPASIYIDGTLYTNESNATCDLTTTGRNALDTGSVAADTPYYLYAIPPTTGTTFDVIASVTAPTGAGPTGFTTFSYIGAFSTFQGAATLPVFRSQNGVNIGEFNGAQSHTGDTNATAVTFDYIPTTATMVYAGGFYSGSTGTAQAGQIKPEATGTTYLQVGPADMSTTDTQYAYGWLPIITANTLYLLTTNSANTIQCNILGWREDPMEYA